MCVKIRSISFALTAVAVVVSMEEPAPFRVVKAALSREIGERWGARPVL